MMSGTIGDEAECRAVILAEEDYWSAQGEREQAIEVTQVNASIDDVETDSQKIWQHIYFYAFVGASLLYI
jgi:UDP-N-acetylmuramyl pentapeptide synthase